MVTTQGEGEAAGQMVPGRALLCVEISSDLLSSWRCLIPPSELRLGDAPAAYGQGDEEAEDDQGGRDVEQGGSNHCGCGNIPFTGL